jgi:predicted ester cyclase
MGESKSSKGNVNAFDELYAADIARHHPPLPDLDGIDAYKQYQATIIGAYSDIQVSIDEIIFERSTSAVRLTFQMTHTGQTPLLRIQPTGKQVTLAAGITARWVGESCRRVGLC